MKNKNVNDFRFFLRGTNSQKTDKLSVKKIKSRDSLGSWIFIHNKIILRNSGLKADVIMSFLLTIQVLYIIKG